MLLSPTQIQDLLQIIDTNQSIFIGKQLGIEFLSEYDKAILKQKGIDIDTLYDPSEDSIYSSFHLGLLAQALEDTIALNKLSYFELKDYIKGGQYIPLSQRDRETINAVKSQTLSDIRKNNGMIFQDINGILRNTVISQEEFIKEEIIEGIKTKRTVAKIASELHHKTGDWGRNFEHIVEYQNTTAMMQGRASMIEQTYGEDAEVYKLVFASACNICLKLYTTEGYRSEPIIFKLSELKANGSNIGRKSKDWKATIDSTHPYCRCLLRFKRKGYLWNEKTQDFDITPAVPIPILKQPRKKIRAKISGKEIFV